MLIVFLSACLVRATDPKEILDDPGPEILQITIFKDGLEAVEIFNDDSVRCEAEVDDLDEIVEPEYLWTLNGAALAETQDLVLVADLATPNDELSCVVSVTDGNGSTVSDESSIQIANRLPTTPVVTISPESPVAEIDDLNCTATGSTDADGEIVSYGYVWESTTGITTEGAVLDNDFAALDSEWLCTATPSDASGVGESGFAGVVLLPNVVCELEPCDDSLPLIQTRVDLVHVSAGPDPLGRYTLTRDFLIQKVETTNGQFSEATGFRPTVGLEDADFGSAGSEHPSLIEPDYAAGFLTWSMAAHFANQLTSAYNTQNSADLELCYVCGGSESNVSCENNDFPYECTGFRLPTAAEWEYAGRSGTTSDIWTENGGGTIIEANTTEPFCNESVISDGQNTPLSDYASYCFVSVDTYGYAMVETVAQRLPNGLGMFDVHGNVAEWTADTALGYTHDMTGENPYVSTQNSDQPYVMFGGTLNNAGPSLAFGSVIQHTDGQRFHYLGVRVVRSVFE